MHRRIHQFFFREFDFLKSVHFNMAACANYKICSQCHLRGSNPFYGVCNECNRYNMSSLSIHNEDNPSKTTIPSQSSIPKRKPLHPIDPNIPLQQQIPLSQSALKELHSPVINPSTPSKRARLTLRPPKKRVRLFYVLPKKRVRLFLQPPKRLKTPPILNEAEVEAAEVEAAEVRAAEVEWS